MLSDERLEAILTRIPELTIGVVGDLFLDRYFDINLGLTEKSLETGHDVDQVERVRAQPGAAGTVVNNLCALGVRRVPVVSVIGDDGEGYELRQALARLSAVDVKHVLSAPDRRTPTYLKLLLRGELGELREKQRIDIKNRKPTPAPLQDYLVEALAEVWPQVDALLVTDQVSEDECGVVTRSVREALAAMGDASPDRLILADSRTRLHLFRSVSVKPNEAECHEALRAMKIWSIMTSPGLSPVQLLTLGDMVRELAGRIGRTVLLTLGELGVVVGPCGPGQEVVRAAAYEVDGPIDIVGAGDSASAAIACAVAAGASLPEAAAFANLVASITIRQLGTTGTASPEQVRARWREVRPQP
jgi:rfaE bifunctional protein kinase chain/domain